MSNITDALKDLYVAFGGKAADVDTLTDITYVANAISALLGGDSSATNIVDALENVSAVIPSGSGGSETLDALIDGSIVELYNDTVTSMRGGSVFASLSALKKVTFTKLRSVPGYAFSFCSSLEYVDLGSIERLDTGGSQFNNCPALTTVIIRSSTIPTYNMSSVAFNDTPINDGTGYIYVPDDLVDSYKAASGWSTYATQIKPISELPTE